MFTAKIENSKNEILELTQNESNFQIVSIEGLNPPNAQINRNTVYGIDGSKFNSAYLNERNIVIMLKLNGDVEENRLNLYRFFRTKNWCKFYYKNERRNVYIEGYIETAECNLFAKAEIMQISIICPDPYFKDAQMIIDDISKTLAAFEFPFGITSSGIEFSTIDSSKITNVYNNSESETGVIIEVNILDSVNRIQIVSVTTGERLTLNYSFIANDKVIINTNKGEKSITLIRDGAERNIFTSLLKGSAFFQLALGDNHFSYLVDSGLNDELIKIVFKHYFVYGGV